MCRLKGHLSTIDYQRKSKVTIKLPNKDDIRENYLNFMVKFSFKVVQSITEIIRQTIVLKKGGVRNIRQRCYHGTKITYLHFCIDDLAL